MRCLPRAGASTLLRRHASEPACGGSTLLVASEADPASVTMADAVLGHAPFHWAPQGAGKWTAESLVHDDLPRVHLWRRPESLIGMDDLEQDWDIEGGDLAAGGIRDVIFLSKHVAASGKPSLTVHPIGNPRRDVEPYGGVAGKLAPPSPRLASLLRALDCAKGTSTSSELADFDVTFEATHHGPLLQAPTLFAEIGSGDDQWGREDAGRCWAEALWAELSTPPEIAGSALVVLGGNHYMSPVTDMVLARRHAGLAMGHMLPSYAFQNAGAEEVEAAVREALESTARALPGVRELVALVFKKQIRSADRKHVHAALERCSHGWHGPELRVVDSRKQLAEVLRATG